MSKIWLGQSTSNSSNLDASFTSGPRPKKDKNVREETINVDRKEDERMMYAVNFKSSKY